MSVREDRVNLIVTVNGDKGRKQLVELENEASKLRASMRGLNKESEDYAKQAKALEAVEKQMGDIRKEIDITKLTVKELNAETRKLRQIRDNLDPASEAFKRVNADIDKLIGRTKELTNSSRTMGTSLTESSQVLNGIKSALPAVGVAAAAAFATQKITAFVGEARQLAFQAQGVEAAFEKINTKVTLEELRTSVRGTASDLQLMTLAVQADNFNIPLETMRVGLEFAQKQATRTGLSVEHLTQSFVTGLGRQSPLILDNLGISLAELNASIASGADFNTAVMEVVNRKLEDMGDVALGAKGRADQLNASSDNLAVTLGKNLNAALDTTVALLGQVAGNVSEDVMPELNAFQKSLEDLRTAATDLGDAVGVDTEKLSFFDAAVAVVTFKLKPFTDGLQGLLMGATTVAKSIGNLTTAVIDFFDRSTEAEKGYKKQAKKGADDAADIEKQRALNREKSNEQFEETKDALGKMFDEERKILDQKKKLEEEESKRQKKLLAEQKAADQERQALLARGMQGSIKLITTELNELNAVLRATDVGSALYLATIDKIIAKSDELNAAMNKQGSIFKAINAERFDISEDSLKQTKFVTAEEIKGNASLMEQMVLHGEQREAYGYTIDRVNNALSLLREKLGGAVIGSEEYLAISAKIAFFEGVLAGAVRERAHGLNDYLAATEAMFNSVVTIFEKTGREGERNIKFQKAAAAATIAFQNAQAFASALAGATAAALSTGPGAPFVLAGYIATMFGIVAGTIKQIRSTLGDAEVPQYYQGGFDDGRVSVRGATDKRVYRAARAQTIGGFVAQPTLTPSGSLGGEKGTEYWIPNHMMRNPAVYRVAQMLEDIRTSRQFAEGGFDRLAEATPSTRSPQPAQDPTAAMLLQTLMALDATLQRGIPAYYDNDQVQKIRKVTGELSQAEQRGVL